MNNYFIFILQIIHHLIIFVNIISPYYFNDNKILVFIIIFNLLLVIQWIIIGKCIFSYFENYTLNIFYNNEYNYYVNNNEKQNSFYNNITEFIEEIQKTVSIWGPVVIPVLNTLVCTYKILKNCNNL